MRKIIESGMSWLNRSFAREESVPTAEATAKIEDAPAVEPSVEPSLELKTAAPASEVVVPQTAAQVIPQQAVKQQIAAVEELAAPEAKVDSVEPETVALEIKILVRGARQYAVCPHCQMIWNIHEQLTDPRRRSGTSQMKRLVCPACEEPVTLPGNMALQRVH